MGREGRASKEMVDAKGERSAAPGLFCRFCGYRVTSDEQRISVNGSHSHTFFNPAGVLFELGCFLHAPGCRVDGDASGHFTWFVGHQWRVALCRQCATHLGWRFEKQDSMFFCLILPHLVDGR
jgi:hypothetical protein